MIYVVICILVVCLAILIHRIWHLHHDQVQNPELDPFLFFAEQERKRHKQFFSPWLTKDEELLAISNKFFPSITLPQPELLKKPDVTPVEIVPLKNSHLNLDGHDEEYFVAVGGPPAAMVAFQQVKSGQRVLYVNQLDSRKLTRPIYIGAANHVERDILTEEPAFISGHTPFDFLWREVKRFLNPMRYDKGVLRDDYPWLTLNIPEWICHPKEWLSGLRVAFSKQQLTLTYAKSISGHDASDVIQDLKYKTHTSCDFIEAFNRDDGKILREPRGAMFIASDDAVWQTLLKDMALLKQSGRALIPINAQEAKNKYGFAPRNVVGIMEKPHDLILEPQFLDTITQAIKAKGGEVHTNWRLKRIWVNESGKGGVLEFVDQESSATHYRRFRQAHLSLGSTLYEPNPYDLVSVTGVSINALVFGLDLFGGPFVCGGTGNHIAVTPLLPPVTIQDEKVSFIRIAVGGCVNPRNRKASRWYTYSGQTAVNALHCIRKALPLDARLKVLSVTGCNRVIGRDGRMVEIHPFIKSGGKNKIVDSITIQIGAGGGGLTQMASACR